MGHRSRQPPRQRGPPEVPNRQLKMPSGKICGGAMYGAVSENRKMLRMAVFCCSLSFLPLADVCFSWQNCSRWMISCQTCLRTLQFSDT